MLDFDFLWRGPETVSAPRYEYYFSRNVFHVILYQLTKFHCLITFTSSDIGQCVLKLFVSQVVTS